MAMPAPQLQKSDWEHKKCGEKSDVKVSKTMQKPFQI